ncbi:DUF47 domain-containing protein [uncultured Veillonella sp.]|uniref:DUF47 domain-containing protein n=1 Tax=uncultured Veillonella sp. TaxID=159268 RepID=UPI002608D39B|nr:DUF47 family protein [uncultured Veillonella sp.]
MAFHLKSKEEKFFNLLNSHAELCHEASIIMEKAFEGELTKEEALTVIDAKEKDADKLVNETVEKLRSTFITPMDREDIQLLISQLDTTIDSMKDIMDKMCMYNVGKPNEGAVKLIQIVQKCLKHITKSISYMNSLKKNHVKVEGRVLEVLRLEEVADGVYHEEMATLFRDCTDPIELIKWKEILNSIEDVIDGCEDLVGTFRRVVLKYA